MTNGIGIDIHPYYQRGVDWPRVARETEVNWVYVKASDGAAPYAKQVGNQTYRPDTHVVGARSVGLPVGVYHYAQFGDPVAQADVLAREHQRLGANLPPMLDLEAPFVGDAKAAAFAKAFLARIAQHGHRPVLYLSSSHARAMRPDLWGIRDLVIWVASYGVNDGLQHPLTGGYPGRVDIHQYTSAGRVNGIAFATDLNRAYLDIGSTKGPSDVALKDETFEFRTPDGRVLRVDALTALANLYAERFYGSSTVPWTGPSGRAIDLGELAEVPGSTTVELPEDFAQQLAEELEARGVGGASPQDLAEAYRAAADKLAPGEVVQDPQ